MLLGLEHSENSIRIYKTWWGVKVGMMYETERMMLKTIGASKVDAEMILDYFTRNKDHLKPWDPMKSEEFYIVENRQRALRWEYDEMTKRTYLRLWIFKKGSPEERIIGTIGVTRITQGESCRIGYSIDKDETNNGLVTEALRMVLKELSEEFGIKRFEATVMPRNKASLRVLEKLGFTEYELLTDFIEINGKPEDHFLMVLEKEA